MDVHRAAPQTQHLPAASVVLLGLQHLLVMAVTPLTAGFLVGGALHLGPEGISSLIASLFLVCGAGTLLQSIGVGGFGARLPFVMIPGGAPLLVFIELARQAGPATATGAVLLAALFNLLVVMGFVRILRLFPPAVIGVMLVLVGINLVRVSGGLITHAPGGLPLAATCIVLTLLLVRLLPGRARQIAIFTGLLGSSALAFALGLAHRPALAGVPVISLPHLLPFGAPRFDVVASVPMLLLGLISMVEATSQTVALSEAVARPPAPAIDVPRTIRADAVLSLLGACLGTSLIITSGENIGIVRATGVRSRRVTAAAGAMLVLLALVTPLNRLVGALPVAAIAGTAIIVSCIISAMGIDMLRRVDLGRQENLLALAGSLVFGLTPILCPALYLALPAPLRLLLGNGLAAGTCSAVLLFAFLKPARHPVIPQSHKD